MVFAAFSTGLATASWVPGRIKISGLKAYKKIKMYIIYITVHFCCYNLYDKLKE